MNCSFTHTLYISLILRCSLTSRNIYSIGKVSFCYLYFAFAFPNQDSNKFHKSCVWVLYLTYYIFIFQVLKSASTFPIAVYLWKKRKKNSFIYVFQLSNLGVLICIVMSSSLRWSQVLLVSYELTVQTRSLISYLLKHYRYKCQNAYLYT